MAKLPASDMATWQKIASGVLKFTPMGKGGKEKGTLSRVFWAFITVFIIGMGAISLIGDQGLISYWRLTDEAQELRAQVKRMELHHRQLQKEIKALKDDPNYIEQLARRELGLVRPGETIIQLPAKAEQEE